MTMVSVTDPDKISIITPFYNPGEYLMECIQSVLEQTYQNWELILVNDLSSDHSPSIADSFAQKDDRIRVLQNTDKGLINALRLAYKNSFGNYITRMDADDIMTPNRLELMIDQLKASGKGHVCVGKVKYFSDKKLGDGYLKYENWLNELTDKEANFSEIYRECSIPSPNFLILRDDFESIGGFDHDTYPEDYDLAFRMYEHHMKVCSVNEVTLQWRDHPTRSTRTQDQYQPLTFIPLKVTCFLKIDRDYEKQLVLWGAGTKGKLIAKELINQGVDFKWTTNNPKKIGKDIYNKILVDSTAFDQENSQVIIGISSPIEIDDLLTKYQRMEGYRFF